MYARTRQIQARNEDATKAALRLRRLRESGQEVFDNEQQLRLRPLERGDLVLAFRSDLETSFSHKLTPRWYGPFKIVNLNVEKHYFFLQEMDGTRIAKPVTKGRLKRFYARSMQH